MAVKNPCYLLKKGSGYYSRIKIPKDLKHKFGKRSEYRFPLAIRFLLSDRRFGLPICFPLFRASAIPFLVRWPIPLPANGRYIII